VYTRAGELLDRDSPIGAGAIANRVEAFSRRVPSEYICAQITE
jgi:hypothetical protein